MGETPIYLNMSTSTTVQTIRSKKVNIGTQGQESWRNTLILKFFASGVKLALLLSLKQTKKKI